MGHNKNERYEVERTITLSVENESDIHAFEQELYDLALKHNMYLLIQYHKNKKID